MTIFQLECFYALAQSLNFTQTANQQFITQPALSRSISSLEQEMNLKLINRTTHKVSLTPAGKVFAEECKKIIEAYQLGIQTAQLATQNLIGSIRLGLPIDSFEPLAVKLVQALTKKHSGIQVKLKFNSPSRLLRSLDDGTVDAIIASGQPRKNPTKALLIDQRQDYIVLACNHPLAQREQITFSELSNENFVAISRASSEAGYLSILRHASKAGFTPKIISEAETISSLLMQVACGGGITVLYKEHQPASEGQIAFVPLVGEHYFNRYLLWNQDDNPFLDAAIAIAKEIYKVKEIKNIILPLVEI